MGELLSRLEARDLLEGTAVIVTSDNGHRFGEQHLVSGLTGHKGNPSFEEVLRAPLIIAQEAWAPDERILRSHDLFGIITGIAGQPATPSRDLEPSELLTDEDKRRLRALGYLDQLRSPHS